MNNKSLLARIGLVSGFALVSAGMYLYVSNELAYTPRIKRIESTPAFMTRISEDVLHHDAIIKNVSADHEQNKIKARYFIIYDSLEDHSLNGFPRFAQRISVPLGLSQEELRQNLLHAAWRLLKEKNANAVIIWGYRDDDRKRNGGFTAGKCTLAPYGDWSKAIKNTDFNSLQATFELAEVYNKNVPVYTIMGDTTTRIGTPVYADIASFPDKVITNLKKGTRVVILEHYRDFSTYDFMDWYKVQTNFSKRKNYAGWVKGENLNKPMKTVDAKSLRKIFVAKNTTPKQSTSDKDWYEAHKVWDKGGTLRQANIREWRNATQTNKLASCADILTNAEANGTINLYIRDNQTLKYYAQELVDFIDASIKGVNGIDQLSVSEIASAGFVLMNWSKR